MDSQLQEFADKTIQSALDLGCQYCDVRAEDITSHSSLIENGSIEHIKTESDRGIGIRIINNGAWGFFSVSNPQSIDEIQEHLVKTVRHTTYYSENKKNPIVLKSVSANQKTIDFPVKEKPTLDDIIRIGLECDKIISEQNRIIKSSVHPWFSQSSKYFANSEGSQILQNFSDVVIDLVATAHESGLTQSVNITEGGRGGLEQIVTAQQSAKEIASKASALIDAKPAKEEQATVVMNPDFVALLTHEILGHPSEADRVLGKEMAWAGGAWWSGKLGEKIGSDSLNVFDNPTIEKSLGWYYFDDEGVPTQNTTLVENGILKNHMQNRETAEIFGTKPTGNMRATSYQFMPLLRMACTCIAAGDYNPDEMIKDVKNGYLISNMKIPSIDMKRYNWSISCQYAQKIENGEPTELLRDVIVMGIAPDFFSSIDACGTDFTVRPITNCGKGDPMQSMIMGNGGPTVRGVATVKSVN